jgi:hypothetical protein
MAESNNNNPTGKITFRDKAAAVYSPKTSFTGNSSISIDRDFTVRFTDSESVQLEQEQSAVRDRLTGSSRKNG